jgi:hypothetical protein
LVRFAAEDAEDLVDPSLARLQHQGVDDREHRSIGADAQAEHEHGDRGEAWRPPQLAEAGTKVSDHGHGLYG